MKYKKPLIVSAAATLLLGVGSYALIPTETKQDTKQATVEVQPKEEIPVEVEPVKDVEEAQIINPEPLPAQEPVPVSTPTDTAPVDENTAEEVLGYINEVASHRQKLPIQNAYYRGNIVMMTGDYRAIVQECITYLNDKYGDNVLPDAQRIGNELYTNVIAKYAS